MHQEKSEVYRQEKAVQSATADDGNLKAQTLNNWALQCHGLFHEGGGVVGGVTVATGCPPREREARAAVLAPLPGAGMCCRMQGRLIRMRLAQLTGGYLLPNSILGTMRLQRSRW